MNGRYSYIVGYTAYLDLRLQEHNEGKSRFTSGKGPWRMVFLERLPDKTAALKREKRLKKANSEYIKWLINQNCNLVR